MARAFASWVLIVGVNGVLLAVKLVSARHLGLMTYCIKRNHHLQCTTFQFPARPLHTFDRIGIHVSPDSWPGPKPVSPTHVEFGSCAAQLFALPDDFSVYIAPCLQDAVSYVHTHADTGTHIGALRNFVFTVCVCVCL